MTMLRRDRTRRVEALNDQIEELVEAGKYETTLPLMKELVEHTRELHGDNSLEYAAALEEEAKIHVSLGHFDQAKWLYSSILQLRNLRLDRGHRVLTETERILRELNSKTTEPVRGTAMPFLPQVDPYAEEEVTRLSHEVFNLHGQGRYREAIDLGRRAVTFAGQMLGEEHPAYATSLNNLATLYYEMGDLSQAEPLNRQAMEIRRRVLGEKHPSYAASLNNLATLYREMGDLSQAEPLHRQALEIQRQVLGEKHPSYARSLNNLAGLYREMGDFSQAEPLHRQALEIQRQVLGEEHPHYAMSLGNLAGLYREMGDFSQAEPLYRQVLEIQRWVLGEKHPSYATSLGNLAALYHDMGELSQAEPLQQQVLEIQRRVLGEKHPSYAMSLGNLATLYSAMGKLSQAEPLCRQALEIRRRVLGEEHPHYAASLVNLALLCGATSRVEEAHDLLLRAAIIENRVTRELFSFASERQRLKGFRRLDSTVATLLSLTNERFHDSATHVRTAMDLMLRRKALTAEALATQRDAILGGRYPALRSELEQLTTLRRQIARKTLEGSGVEGIAVHLQSLVEWTKQKEQLEVSLARAVPEMRLDELMSKVDTQQVASRLPAGSVSLSPLMATADRHSTPYKTTLHRPHLFFTMCLMCWCLPEKTSGVSRYRYAEMHSNGKSFRS